MLIEASIGVITDHPMAGGVIEDSYSESIEVTAAEEMRVSKLAKLFFAGRATTRRLLSR